MAIEIRPATDKDIFKIIDYRMEFLREVSGNEMNIKFRETTLDYLKKHINSDSVVCYLAIENDRIISMVILCIYCVIPKLHNSTGMVGYLFNVYTLKNYRGQGFAKELISKTIETAKKLGVKEIYLNGEEKAIPLYRRFGFKCLDREMILVLE